MSRDRKGMAGYAGRLVDMDDDGCVDCRDIPTKSAFFADFVGISRQSTESVTTRAVATSGADTE